MSRSVSSVALQLLRGLEEILMKGATHNLVVRTRTDVALYVLNHKRGHLRDLESSFKVTLSVIADPTVSGQQSFIIDRGEQVHTLEAAKALLAAQVAAFRRRSRKPMRTTRRSTSSPNPKWKPTRPRRLPTISRRAKQPTARPRAMARGASGGDGGVAVPASPAKAARCARVMTRAQVAADAGAEPVFGCGLISDEGESDEDESDEQPAQGFARPRPGQWRTAAPAAADAVAVVVGVADRRTVWRIDCRRIGGQRRRRKPPTRSPISMALRPPNHRCR